MKNKIAKNRWFIWTVVFLVLSGVSLVSYISLSDDGTRDAYAWPVHHVKTQHHIVRQ